MGETEDGLKYKFYQHLEGEGKFNIEALKSDLSKYTKIDLLDYMDRYQSIDEFDPETYTSDFDDSVFDLPTGDQVNGSCYVSCPAGGFC